MSRAGAAQVRPDAQRIEVLIGGETGRGVRVGRAGGMQPADEVSDLACDLRVDVAGEELRLPDRVSLRGQILHCEQAGVRVMGKHPRHLPGT